MGRPSIAPELLLRALLLQIFYWVRSERLLMEQLDDNLLFRWFVGLAMDEPVWNHAVFRHNRERPLNEEIAEVFFQRVLGLAQPYLSDEHFSMVKTKAGSKRITVGGDKNFDTREFVEKLRKIQVTSRVAQNTARPGGSAIDERTTRHPGYTVSQRSANASSSRSDG